MKKFLTALVLTGLFFAGNAFAEEGFELAKSVVDALSAGTYYLKYRQNPADFAPVTVYNVKDGMVVSFSERVPQPRNLSRDGDWYVINDDNKIMEIYEGRATPPMFGRGPYVFAGRGEKTEGDKTLRYEEAVLGDGTTVRFFFEDTVRYLLKVSVLSQIELTRPGAERSAFFFVTEFGASVRDSLFDVPKYYTVLDNQQLELPLRR